MLPVPGPHNFLFYHHHNLLKVEKLKSTKNVSSVKKTSWLRRFNDWFHLWIGIMTGIPIIIVSLTGCMLVFEQEITAMTRSFWSVQQPKDAKTLPPSLLRQKVTEQVPDMKIRRLWYYGEGKPVKISPDNSDTLIFANPYTGVILAMEDHENIFDFIEDGHRNLWFPDKVGRQIVTWCTTIFLVLIITGIVLWWPKKWNKRELKQALMIKWKAKFKRVNYDLHNVLGFYSMFLTIVMLLTGLMMGFTFVNKTVMKLLGAKDGKNEVVAMAPGPREVPASIEGKVDYVWQSVTTELGEFEKDQISIHFPKEDGKSIYACTDMYNGTWRELNFDINTLALLSTSQTKIAEDIPSKWLRRSNFSLHVGAFGGTFTKWLYFIASFICGTLPITGFIIWWGKRNKKTKGKKVQVAIVQ